MRFKIDKERKRIYNRIDVGMKMSRIKQVMQDSLFYIKSMEIKNDFIYVDALRVSKKYRLIIPRGIPIKVITISRLVQYNTIVNNIE